MVTYAIMVTYVGWQVMRITGGVAQPIASAIDQPTAERIRDLLDRHGMIDVPLRDVTF